jgi:hypothetical protein
MRPYEKAEPMRPPKDAPLVIYVSLQSGNHPEARRPTVRSAKRVRRTVLVDMRRAEVSLQGIHRGAKFLAVKTEVTPGVFVTLKVPH